MKSKVVVIPHEDQFLLRTSFGFKIGSRMLTASPEGGQDFPELTDRFATRLEADRAALKWNVYLIAADKKRAKTTKRSGE